jgi:inorganic pyrophosphatase
MRPILAALAVAFVLFAPAAAHAQPTVAHPWHGVDPAYDGEGTFHAVIEIPRGSKNKYEIDKPTGLLKLDRVLKSDDGYPADYGFIPKSYGHDGDPLDVLVISSHAVSPLTIVEARTIGVLRMTDSGEGDDKILAVNPTDPVYGKIRDVSELPKEKLDEIESFFKTYKLREGKTVTVEKPEGPDAARKIIEESFRDYGKLRARSGFFGPIRSLFGKARDVFAAGLDRLSGIFKADATRAPLGERKGLSDALAERVGEATRVGVERDGR